MHIRRANLKDFSEIHRHGVATKEFWVTRKTFFYEKPELKQYLKDRKKNIFLVAEINDEIAGFIHGIILSKYWCIIDTMMVCREYRGKGIGSRLVETLREMAKKIKIEYLQGLVITDNKRGLKFWKKQGFT